MQVKKLTGDTRHLTYLESRAASLVQSVRRNYLFPWTTDVPPLRQDSVKNMKMMMTNQQMELGIGGVRCALHSTGRAGV